MKIWACLAFLSFSLPAFAYHDTDCAEKVWLADGWIKKYDLKYSTVDFISFKTSTAEGSTGVTTKSSTQESSASVDPGVTTGKFMSTTQYTSSFGACSMWASNERWMRREMYVAENHESLRQDVARGGGEYVRAMAQLSGCPTSVSSAFATVVHAHYQQLFDQGQPWAVATQIDRLVESESSLRNVCGLSPFAG